MWYEIKIISHQDVYEKLSTFFIMNDIYDLSIEDKNLINEFIDSGTYWDYLDDDFKGLNHNDKDCDKEERLIIYKSHFEGGELDLISILDDFKQFFVEEISNELLLLSYYEIDPNEGVDSWKEYFKPFKICGDIVICPSWEEYDKSGSEIVINMDPGSAFGTGTHETTSICANFLSNCNVEGKKILDIGTGSGILSIISLSLGASTAFAFDIEQSALEASVENAKLNGFSEKIKVLSAEFEYGNDYDVILSNLTAPILIELSDRILDACKMGTILIMSGILIEKKIEVLNKFLALGFKLIDEKIKGEWYGCKLVKV